MIAVYSENYTKFINTECTFTSKWSRWYIQLSLGCIRSCNRYPSCSSSSSMALSPVFRPWIPQHSSSTLRGFSWGSGTNPSFTGWGQPHVQPPNWRTNVSLFVWVITFDLSGMGAPASSFATARIALRILWPHKPRHYVKVEIPSAGNRYLCSYRMPITGLAWRRTACHITF
jgi:hypothetical protein